MLEFYGLQVLILFYVLTGMFVFSSIHKHLLITLLRLEYIMLNVFFISVFVYKAEVVNSYIILIFLVFIVTEGSVGLSVLVALIRSHGRDIIKRFRVV
jgi:NADH:ubiquinone oxidoreductase subunit K